MLISIDPGVRGCGVARWECSPWDRKGVVSFSPHLITAYYSPTEWGPACGLSVPVNYREVVCELPQVYQGRQQKGDPNDLIDLAEVVGQIHGWALFNGLAFRTVKPREWKGQLPKEVCHKRLLARLSTVEATSISNPGKTLYHNVLDAVGIGLWALGRFSP